MRKLPALVAFLALAAAGCSKTADGDIQYEKPVIGTQTDTVNIPTVEVSTDSVKVAVPKVEMSKDSTTIKVPTVQIKK